MVNKDDIDPDEPTSEKSYVASLTREGFEELLDATKTPSEELTVFLLWHTGMRLSSAANFIPDQFDEENQIVRVQNVAHPSADSDEQWRQIALSDEATDKLRSLLNQVDDEVFEVSRTAIRSRIIRIADRTENVTATPYSFRKSFIKRPAEAGLTPKEMRRLAGDSLKPIFQANEESGDPREKTTVNESETLERVIEKFISENESSWGEITKKHYWLMLTSFSEWCESRTDDNTVEAPRQLTTLIDEYLEYRSDKVAPETNKRTESQLRRFERWWNSDGQNV